MIDRHTDRHNTNGFQNVLSGYYGASHTGQVKLRVSSPKDSSVLLLHGNILDKEVCSVENQASD